MNMHFTFKPAIGSQYNLIQGWLQQDYIAKWIHGTGLQNTLNGLEKWFQYNKLRKKSNRTLAITQHWVGFDGQTPFIYMLTSNVNKTEDGLYAKHSRMPGHAITLDIFIGDPIYLGKGLAVNIIHEFLLSHFLDIDEVFIDPEKTNSKAVHVYQKAGFKIIDEFIASWHLVPHYLMKLNLRNLVR